MPLTETQLAALGPLVEPTDKELPVHRKKAEILDLWTALQYKVPTWPLTLCKGHNTSPFSVKLAVYVLPIRVILTLLSDGSERISIYTAPVVQHRNPYDANSPGVLNYNSSYDVMRSCVVETVS